MAFESSTIMTTTDPSKVSADLNDLVRPALLDLGALSVMAGGVLTGPMIGSYALFTRWETLDAWSAADVAMSARMGPGGDMAEISARYQIALRMLANDVLEAGNPTGQYLNTSRFSFASVPQGIEHGSELMLNAGINGLRVLNVMAGGERTGHLVAISFVDSLDTLSAALAATVADAQFVADSAAAGAHLESRTIFRIL